MAYEKHEWQTGEVITAENLNHVEEGIKGLSEALVMHYKNDTFIDAATRDNDTPTQILFSDIIQNVNGPIQIELVNEIYTPQIRLVKEYDDNLDDYTVTSIVFNTIKIDSITSRIYFHEYIMSNDNSVSYTAYDVSLGR